MPDEQISNNSPPLRGTAFLLSHRHKILNLLASEEGQVFLEWLRGWQVSANHRVRKGRDLIEIHRAQGELDVVERILGLEIELKEYIKRSLKQQVAENERQRVEKEAGNAVG